MTPAKLKNKIVVIRSVETKDMKAFEHAIGLVLQNHPDDMESEKVAQEIANSYSIPIITRADGAIDILKPDQFVTLDSAKGLIFKGSVISEKEVLDQVCRYQSKF